MMTEQAETKKPLNLHALAAEVDGLRAELEAAKANSASADTADVQHAIEDLQLRLAALAGRTAPADVVLNQAQQSLEKIQALKKSGGKYRWLIEKPWYASRTRKGQESRVPSHEFWSDATTEKAVIEDFRRRTRVQTDTSDRRGEPFRAVKVDPELLGTPPQSL